MQSRYLGVYAIAILNSQILVTKKGRGPFTGRWDLPGGGLEFGESPQQTLHRELLEETGLQLTSFSLLNVWSHLILDPRPDHIGEQTHHLGILYRITTTDLPPLSTPDGQDSLESRWLPLADLHDSNATPFLARAVRECSP